MRPNHRLSSWKVGAGNDTEYETKRVKNHKGNVFFLNFLPDAGKNQRGDQANFSIFLGNKYKMVIKKF